MNVCLQLEYDGAPFKGWQRQGAMPTVQATVEDAIAQVLGRRVPLQGASRTDTGVHALGQVANFETLRNYEAGKWKNILNGILPPTIRVLEAREVPPGFNACRDAISKTYEYRILNSKVASALDRRVYFYPGQLNWSKMSIALPHFLGERDFRSLQVAGSRVKTTVRTISRFELRQHSPTHFSFVVQGSGFLKQMVRTMMGTVIEIGEGKRKPADIPAVLESKDRRMAGRTLPANALFLISVEYPVVT